MTDVKLPESWLKINLEEILLTIVGGGTPSKARPEYYQGDIPWMSVKDMNKHTLMDTVDHITQDAVKNSSTNIIPAGTPIIATRMSLGKIITASFDSAINQDLKALFLSTCIDRDFFIHWYRSQAQLIESLGTGTTVKGIRLEVLKALLFPFAPMAEQKIIADKLETLLAQVDSAKARLEKIPPILKRFRQSVLSAAVSGKLTEEWREERLLTIDDWLITCVGNIAQVATGKTPKRTEPKYWDNGSISWLTSSSTGNSITTSAEQFVTELALKECTLKLFGPGTLLLAMYGEGKTRGQVTELKLNAACNQACAAITVIEEKVHRSFMKIRLMENYEETRKTAVGGNQPNLNLNKVREISINLPSLQEQAQIVSCVEQLFAYADTIEKQVHAALLRINNLTQSILAKAYRGELTAQWRTENPSLISGENSAEVILVRIKQERSKSKPVKRGKGNN